MTMWGFMRNGKFVPGYGLHKSRMVALGAYWERQPSLRGIAFSERRCLVHMAGLIAVMEVEVNA